MSSKSSTVKCHTCIVCKSPCRREKSEFRPPAVMIPQVHKVFLRTPVVLFVSVHLWALAPANDIRMHLPLVTLTVVLLCASVNACRHAAQLPRDSIPWLRIYFGSNFFFWRRVPPVGRGGTRRSRIRIRIRSCSKSMIRIRIRTQVRIRVRTFDPDCYMSMHFFALSVIINTQICKKKSSSPPQSSLYPPVALFPQPMAESAERD